MRRDIGNRNVHGFTSPVARREYFFKPEIVGFLFFSNVIFLTLTSEEFMASSPVGSPVCVAYQSELFHPHLISDVHSPGFRQCLSVHEILSTTSRRTSASGRLGGGGCGNGIVSDTESALEKQSNMGLLVFLGGLVMFLV